MNKDTRLPAPDTFPDLLLTMTALSGEFPSSLVGRLPGSMYYKRNAVTGLKKKGLLYKYSHDGLHGLRLTSTAKNLLLTQQPDRYDDILAGNSVLNTPKYAAVKRTRLHRMAEVLVAMHNAGVLLLPWEKPVIYQEDGRMKIDDVTEPTYYTSLEIKGAGDEGCKFTGSRATGVLYTCDSAYLTFNTGAAEMKWDSNSEIRLKVVITHQMLSISYIASSGLKQADAIMFVADMSQMEVLMRGGRRKRRNQIVLDDFEHFHYLTNDYQGETVLRLLCDPELKAALDNVLLEDLTPVAKDYFRYDCDALDEGGTPVLLGYTCDMSRIRRFDAGLSIQKTTGILYCFDFQADTLRRICSPQVQLQILDFDAVDRYIILSFEKSRHRLLNRGGIAGTHLRCLMLS